MKNKIMKFMCIFVSLVICLLFLVNNVSFATDPASNISAAMNWNSDGNIEGKAKTITGTAINVVRIVATGIAIIMLTYVAIKYMSAAPEGKAEFKKSATAYIVGAVVLFGTSGILGIIKNFADKNL